MCTPDIFKSIGKYRRNGWKGSVIVKAVGKVVMVKYACLDLC